MALLGLHVPDGLPVHPIIGKLPKEGLSGFTQYLLTYGAADGSLTQSANLYYNTNLYLTSGKFHIDDAIEFTSTASYIDEETW